MTQPTISSNRCIVTSADNISSITRIVAANSTRFHSPTVPSFASDRPSLAASRIPDSHARNCHDGRSYSLGNDPPVLSAPHAWKARSKECSLPRPTPLRSS